MFDRIIVLNSNYTYTPLTFASHVYVTWSDKMGLIAPLQVLRYDSSSFQSVAARQ